VLVVHEFGLKINLRIFLFGNSISVKGGKEGRREGGKEE
jgi:hypothetical protein